MYDIIAIVTAGMNAATPRLALNVVFKKDNSYYAGSNVDIVIYNLSICECSSANLDELHELLMRCPNNTVGTLPGVNYALDAYEAKNINAEGVHISESETLVQRLSSIESEFSEDETDIDDTNERIDNILVPYSNIMGNPTMNPENTEAEMSFTNLSYSDGVYTYDTSKYAFTYRSSILHSLESSKDYVIRIKAKAKNDANTGIVFTLGITQGSSFIFSVTNIYTLLSGAPSDGEYDIVYPFNVSANGSSPKLSFSVNFYKDAWYAGNDVDIDIHNISICECSASQKEYLHSLLNKVPYTTVGILPISKQAVNSMFAESIEYNAFGKKVLVLGDSIFSLGYEYVSNNLQSMLLPSVYTNVAVPGAKVCDTSASQVYDGNPTTGNANNVLGNQVQKVLNNKQAHTAGYDDFDYCIISCGTNDGPASWGWDGPKPTYQGWIVPTDEDIEAFFTGDVNAGSTGSFIDIDLIDRQSPIGALRWSVEKLMNAYPHMNVFICNPIQCAQGNAGSNYLTNIHKCDTISRVARRLAAVSIPNERCGIYGRFETWGENGRYLQDGLHPNADGGMLLARYVCDEIIKFFTTKGNLS